MTRSAPLVAISINTSWNLINFRRGLLKGLRDAGYDIVALSPSDGHENQLAALGVRHIPIEIDRKGLSPARDARLLARYRSILAELRPAAFLGYTAKPNIYGGLAAQSLGIPVVNNIAGLGTAFLRGGWLGFVVTQLYRLALHRSRVVFFQNADDQALFAKLGIRRAGDTRLLPGSGIDLDAFAPITHKTTGHRFTFLLIARLLWDKGVGEYAEAARLLRAEGFDGHFALLGAIDDENRSAVSQAQLDGWLADGTLRHLGQADDVRPHIAAADAIVLPSYREGLPRVLLEGAAMGKPLVATDVPGCRDVVDDGVNGFLCAARSGPDLARAMRRLASLPSEERARMGSASRAKVEARFGEHIVIDAYLHALAEVIQPGPVSR